MSCQQVDVDIVYLSDSSRRRNDPFIIVDSFSFSCGSRRFDNTSNEGWLLHIY